MLYIAKKASKKINKNTHLILCTMHPPIRQVVCCSVGLQMINSWRAKEKIQQYFYNDVRKTLAASVNICGYIKKKYINTSKYVLIK